MLFNQSLIQKIKSYSKTLFQSIYGFSIITSRYIYNKKTINVNNDQKVTLVITSCNRLDLLKQTIESFNKYNTYPIEKIVHIEDGQSKESIDWIRSYFNKFEVISIFNETNIGQLNSIDLAYSYVDTEFIFHLEEDWLFVKSGFIEYSMNILNTKSNVIFVSLRNYNDQNGHPLKKLTNNFFMLKPFWKLIWIGYGFNPSLRRKYDYDIINKYGGLNKRETSIGLFYYIFLKKYVIVSKSSFYVEHIGWNHSTVKDYLKA